MTELLKRFEEAVANEETDLVEKIYRDAINKNIADPLQTLYESYFATYFQFEPILVSGKDTLKKDCLRIKEKRINFKKKIIEFEFNETNQSGKIIFLGADYKIENKITGSKQTIEVDLNRMKIIQIIDGELSSCYVIDKKRIDNILLGFDGWLFLKNDRNDSIGILDGSIRLKTDAEIMWREFAKSLKRLPESKSCFLICPLKEKVYSEYYPYKEENENSLYNDVKKILQEEDVRFYYPLDDLIKNKPRGYMYSKTDTHWTYAGAWVALKKLLIDLGYDIKESDEFKFKKGGRPGNLGSKFIPQITSEVDYPDLSNKQSFEIVFENQLQQDGQIQEFINENAKFKEKVVLFGDSSSRYWYPLLATLFKKVVCLRSSGGYIEDILEYEKPNLILIERGERFTRTPPTNYQKLIDCPLFFKKSLSTIKNINKILTSTANPIYKGYLKVYSDRYIGEPQNQTRYNLRSVALSEKIDIACVVFEGDLKLLILQIISISQNFEIDQLGNYLIILNSESNRLKEEIEKHLDIIDIKKQLKNKIKFIHRQELIKNKLQKEIADNGYALQQCLKLLISQVVQSKHYLLLDAKNHFIRKTSFDDYYQLDKIKTQFKSLPAGRHLMLLKNSLAEIGAKLKDGNEFCMPIITPYMMITEEVRNLVKFVENKHNKAFVECFVEDCKNCTEFFLYFSWLLKNGSFTHYCNAQSESVTLFTKYPESHELCKKLIANATTGNIKVFGLHRKRISQLDGEEIKLLGELWGKSNLTNIFSKEYFLT